MINAGYKVTILDNNGHKEALKRVGEIVGHEQLQKLYGDNKIPFVDTNLTDKDALFKLFKEKKFDGVIHYAALKAVGESVAQPLKYYQNNLTGTLNLLEAMNAFDCKTLVFSSSATVYQPSEVSLFGAM